MRQALEFERLIMATKTFSEVAGAQNVVRLPVQVLWEAHDILHGKTVKIHKFQSSLGAAKVLNHITD